MPRRSSAPKRNPIVTERDLAIILEGKCKLKSPGEILDELNAFRAEEARQIAKERNLPPEAAEEFVEHSRLSRQTLFGDFNRLKKRMQASNLAQGRELMRRQYDRLETMRQTYVLLERRAWQELERSAGASLSTTEEEAIDVTPPLAHEKGLVNTVLKPKVRRVDQPAAADPAWFVILDRLLWRQVELAERMFQLEAMLGLETPPDVAALTALTPDGARAGFIEHDLRLLFSPEARAAKLDPGAFKARFALYDAWAAAKAREAGVGGEEEGESGFRVVGLQIEIEQEPS